MEMGEIERILELMVAGKLSREETQKLIETLSPGVAKMRPELVEMLFEKLASGDMTIADVSELLSKREMRDGNSRDSQNRREFHFGFGNDDLGIGAAVRVATEAAQQAARAAIVGVKKGMEPTRKGARLVKIEIETSDGTDVNVNIPLGLANYALKLMPNQAREALKEQGFEIETLQSLLQSDELPDGELIHVDASDGTTVSISVE
jgi:hypothetical protein